MANDSTIERLKLALDALTRDVNKWLIELHVQSRNPRNSPIFVIGPELCWDEPTPEQRNLQMTLKRRYEPLIEVIRVIFSGAPQSTFEMVEAADKNMRKWLELEPNYSLTHIPEDNARAFGKDVEAMRSLLTILEVEDSRELILIPDTNALLVTADPCKYRSIAAREEFTFLLVPTVLGELDQLKIQHRNADVREKAQKAIQRIKGWRKQGSLHDGVTVDKSITVKAEHREPNMTETLSWLDANVADDRLIASVLSVQTLHPSSETVLVTGDINLQNKAEAAFIETREIA